MMNNGNQEFNGQSYQQPDYPQGDIYARLGGKKSQTNELLALCLGILSLPLCCCTYPAIILGIASIVMAVRSRDDNNGKLCGMAWVGLICSIISVTFGVLDITGVLAKLGQMMSGL